MSIESPSGLIDYWHDLYVWEMNTRHAILDVLTLPMTAEEKLAEIARVAIWRREE